MATGEQSSMHKLASMLLAGQLQKSAYQNGVTSNGATMAVMPDIQVSMVGIKIMGLVHVVAHGMYLQCCCLCPADCTVGLAVAVSTHGITADSRGGQLKRSSSLQH